MIPPTGPRLGAQVIRSARFAGAVRGARAACILPHAICTIHGLTAINNSLYLRHGAAQTHLGETHSHSNRTGCFPGGSLDHQASFCCRRGAGPGVDAAPVGWGSRGRARRPAFARTAARPAPARGQLSPRDRRKPGAAARPPGGGGAVQLLDRAVWRPHPARMARGAGGPGRRSGGLPAGFRLQGAYEPGTGQEGGGPGRRGGGRPLPACL